MFNLVGAAIQTARPSIYIAGPMSGIQDFNYPAFFDAAEAFEDGGWDVFNPAKNDLDQFGSVEVINQLVKEDKDGFLRHVLGQDLEFITQEADAIAMLPGWEKSLGARAEHATAVALGLQIIYL